MWPPRNPPPTWPSRQRPDVPTLTSPDFVLTSGAQVAPTVEPWQAGLGRRRRDGGPGPTKPVQPLSTPRRGASPRTCDRPQRPRNPPLQGRRASDPAKAGIHRAGCPHPVAQRPPAQQTRKGGPHARRWTQTRPCWRSCNVPPPGATPLLAYLRKTPPGPTDPARDPDRSQSKEDHPTASARAPPPGNNCCFTPRPASKDDKKHKAILQREINHTALLLTEAAKLFNDATPQPSPTKPSR